jgi:hypothetical protein
MPRRSALTRLAFAAVTLAAAAAPADTKQSSDPSLPPAAGARIAVPTPPELFTTPHAQISGTIFLERCRDTCTVTQGPNDARVYSSSIPKTAGAHTISEYRNGAGETGTLADAEWNDLVQCLREVYSPFSVQVTDVRPTAGSYHMAIIAGAPAEIGFGPDILGVAPLATDCSPQDNAISFSFANAHPQTETLARVQNLCWTAAQESAHAFGLDHQYEFIGDKRSTCNDPTTYRVDCGGQKFFRNASASCGEFQTRPCRCGASQNSHLKLLSVFDASTAAPLIGAPTAEVTLPRAADGVLGPTVAALAGSKRGVSKVEVLFNGFKWAEVRGAPFGQLGQPVPSTYGIQVPAALPDSIVDVQIRACDDLGACTDSAVVTVIKGGPCTSAETCAKGQRCEEGRCLWDPPSGEIGDPCSYSQFCISGICRGTAEKQICTQDCLPDILDSCPAEYACVPVEDGKGICFFPDDGGCCSASRDPGVPWAQVAFAVLTLGVLVRPWRRRR